MARSSDNDRIRSYYDDLFNMMILLELPWEDSLCPVTSSLYRDMPTDMMAARTRFTSRRETFRAMIICRLNVRDKDRIGSCYDNWSLLNLLQGQLQSTAPSRSTMSVWGKKNKPHKETEKQTAEAHNSVLAS